MVKSLDNIVAVILAGGFARRLAPITDYIPKPLLLINGVSVIDHLMEPILESNIRDIIISTNAKFENAFRYWLKNFSLRNNNRNLNIYLSIENSESEEQKLGAIGGLDYTLDIMNLYNSDNDVLIVLGDNLFTFRLLEFLSYSKKKDRIVIGGYRLYDINSAKKYGVLKLDKNNRVINFVEKPENPDSDIVSIGIYYFPNHKLKLIKDFVEYNRGKKVDAIGKLFEYLIEKDEVYSFIFDKGLWWDIGTIDSYKEANEWASKNKLGSKYLWP